ncbi:MAG TPA: asparagine synthetase B, partial [Bacteroidia bacterium]|nr:asparagine synthetase B [Bacteroidia bacterium]
AGVDICPAPFDGDPADPECNKKLNYDNCFAFTNFTVSLDAKEYSKSNIDVTPYRVQKYGITQENDFFTLFDFSAKWDPVPAMLCQDHTKVIKGFWGQTTAFNESYIKSGVTIMGENKGAHEAKYIHGDYGKGTWTFYGGHDPECYQHRVGDPPTDLSLHPNSPGYRLILNNVLFPAAKKKKRET